MNKQKMEDKRLQLNRIFEVTRIDAEKAYYIVFGGPPTEASLREILEGFPLEGNSLSKKAHCKIYNLFLETVKN